MTLQEYIKQEDPIKPGTVVLEHHELNGWWNVEGGYNIQLRLPIGSDGFIGTYFVLKNDTILWTINDKGVMDKQSVFKLKEAL